MPELEIKPCVCGGISMTTVVKLGYYYETCLNCGAVGPIEYSKEEAIEAWNKDK